MAGPPVRVLAALCSPTERGPLALLRELRELREVGVHVESLSAARIEDVERELNLNNGKYHVFHYAGHYGDDGPLFHEQNNDAKPVPPEAFVAILGASHRFKCIVINGCDSFIHEQLYAQIADHVVTTTGAVDDGVAIAFSRHFYNALVRLSGETHDVRKAYESACRLLQVSTSTYQLYVLSPTHPPTLGDSASATPDGDAPIAYASLAPFDKLSVIRMIRDRAASSSVSLTTEGADLLNALDADFLDDLTIHFDDAGRLNVLARKGSTREQGYARTSASMFDRDAFLIYTPPRPHHRHPASLRIVFRMYSRVVVVSLDGSVLMSFGLAHVTS